MNEILEYSLLFGGIVTLTAGLQGITLDKFLQFHYQVPVTEAMGRLFARVWGFNTFILGVLMIVASQMPTLSNTIAVAAMISKILLIITILFSDHGSLRIAMKNIVAIDGVMVLFLFYGLVIK